MWIDLGMLDGCSDEPGFHPRNPTTGAYQPPPHVCEECGQRYVAGPRANGRICRVCSWRRAGRQSWAKRSGAA